MMRIGENLSQTASVRHQSSSSINYFVFLLLLLCTIWIDIIETISLSHRIVGEQSLTNNSVTYYRHQWPWEKNVIESERQNRTWWKRSMPLSTEWIRKPIPRSQRPDRRLFFSFNQFILSMIAPRLMRYQFDLMMHSVIAELFRKILVPAVAGNVAGNSPSILGSIGNLLRLRQTAAAAAGGGGQRTNPVSGVSKSPPQQAPPPPTVDVQRLLDNAQRLIALQGLLGNNRNQQAIKSNNNNRHSPHNKPSIMVNSDEGITKSSLNVNTINNNNENNRPQTNGETKVDRQPNTTSAIDHQPTSAPSPPAIQLSLNPNDFINFIQNGFRLNGQSHLQKPNSSLLTSTIANIAKQSGIQLSRPSSMQSKSNINQNHAHNPISETSLTGQSNQMAEFPMTNLKSSIEYTNDDQNVINVPRTLKKKPKISKSRTSKRTTTTTTTRPNEQRNRFKMSHLTFIDTEVPNYGNQLLVRDPMEKPAHLGLIDPSILVNNDDENGGKSLQLTDLSNININNNKNDDLERANRWNDVLVNMNSFNNKP
ncbi:hypothetical protein RDWZM_000878 [Blomia tropicalis]|uniref:Uncharacterized protein n=1 Tax=Blomia tropicalis TaxID=40697 RepID=A0A9Q0M9Q6_BLOTA|nr:hypothetical protein RDWZM_000878 [Blomia tropicalis]